MSRGVAEELGVTNEPGVVAEGLGVTIETNTVILCCTIYLYFPEKKFSFSFLLSLFCFLFV